MGGRIERLTFGLCFVFLDGRVSSKGKMLRKKRGKEMKEGLGVCPSFKLFFDDCFQ